MILNSTIDKTTYEVLYVPDLSGLEDIKIGRLKRWIEALRSGKYCQTRKVLRKDTESAPGFCCLGVASNISRLGKWVTSYGGFFYEVVTKTDSFASDIDLPDLVKDFYGLPGPAGFSIVCKTHACKASFKENLYLSDLNDGGVSFSQIADLIETALNGGFGNEA